MRELTPATPHIEIPDLTKLPELQLTLAEGSRHPWQPLAGETDQEYLAFLLWCYQGHSRQRVISRISIDRGWEQRALAYDDWLQQAPLNVQESAEIVGKSLSGTMIMVAQALRLEGMKLLLQVSQAGMSGISLADLTTAIERIAKVSRLLADKSTENIGIAGKLDLTKLSAAEFAQFEETLRKAAVTE